MKVRRPQTKWKFLPSGRLKIKIDGAFNLACRKGGIGIIARNYQGDCLAVVARSYHFSPSALYMETEALKAGLLLGIYEG